MIDARVFDSAQVVYNMLNPSAADALPANYPAQDYGRLFDHTRAAGVGVVGIRVLAGGALSGSAERHPIASPPPEPIGSAMSYDADVVRARRLMPLVKEGFAASLTEAATRFALSHPAMGTILVGMATPQQFEDALAAVQKARCRPPRSTGCQRCSQAFAGEIERSERAECHRCLTVAVHAHQAAQGDAPQSHRPIADVHLQRRRRDGERLLRSISANSRSAEPASCSPR